MSLGARLAAIFAALVAVAVLLTSLVGAASTRSEVNSDIDKFLRGRADDIVSGRRDGPGQPGDRLSEVVEEARTTRAVDADAEVQAIDRDAIIVATTGVTLPVSAVDRDLAMKRGESLRTVEIDGDSYRMITRHIDGGGAIQVARSLETTDDLLGSIRNRLLVIALVLSAAAALIGWAIARRTTRPLRSLTETVERVADTQDLSTSIDVTGSDEVGRLAVSFHEMLDALARSREQQHHLVQDAAHELRTPLTSIQANVDLLSRAPDLDEGERQETLASIRSELRSLNTVFTEIVELATDSRDASPRERVDFVDAVNEAVVKFRMRSDAEVEVIAASTPVSGEPAALERAVTNLLGNAEKFSPEGQPITVRVANGAVSVRDRGPGIPETEHERVFDRFYRAPGSETQPGSGLGLAIVKKVAEDHGGDTFVRSPTSGGSEIGFTIPVLEG